VSPAATETPRVREAQTGDEEGEGDGDAEGGEGDEADGDAEATEEEPAAETVTEEPVVAEPPPPIDIPIGPPKKLTNQFNFCDRAALTYNNPYRVRAKIIGKYDIYSFL
jgi:dynein intermediate chain 1